MVQPGEFLQNRSFNVFGFTVGAVAGVCLLIVLFGITRAMTKGVVFLRTTMPSEPSIYAAREGIKDAAADDAEQRLVDKLYREDQAAVSKVVENDQQWRVVRMRVTAYCACVKCCGKTDGITACNHKIRPGNMFVAADKAYQFRTEMVVPGYNMNRPVQVLDRGGLIKGNRLDVFFPSHSIAKKWGTRYLDVLVREN